jgi:hypothetical protein
MPNPSINRPTIIFNSISYRQVKPVFVQKADMFPLVSLKSLHERMICEIPEHVINFEMCFIASGVFKRGLKLA